MDLRVGWLGVLVGHLAVAQSDIIGPGLDQ